MVLESLSSDRLNIKDLVLDKPTKKGVPPAFDPRVDINLDEWHILVDGNRRFLDQQFLSQARESPFLSSSMELKILGDLRNQQTGWEVSDWALGEIKENITSRRERHDWMSLVENLMIARQLFPEELNQITTQKDLRNDYKGVVKSLRGIQQFSYRFLDTAFYGEFVFPGRMTKLKNVQRFWPEVKNLLEEYKEYGNWSALVYLASRSRILYRQNFSEVELDARCWRGMKQWLDSFRQDDDYQFFSRHALSLTILATYDVRMTNNGFEFILDKPEFAEAIPPMPLRRRF